MSEYSQTSFLGGMNLLSEDTRLASNQYRLGLNVRNRYDVLDPVRGSVLDASLPSGLIQEVITFGEYIVAFVSGAAYFRHYTAEGWQHIVGFNMAIDAPRYWTCQVPLATTNYIRASSNVNPTDGVAIGYITTDSTNTSLLGNGTKFESQLFVGSIITAADGTYIGTVTDIANDTSATISANATVTDTNYQYAILNLQVDNRSLTHHLAATGYTGNTPGLLIQDNINQPIFLYVVGSVVQARITKTYEQWSFDYDINTGIMSNDNREYVPVGNTMAFVDGVLYIASQDGSEILRSVSGRPLDFVINIKPNGDKGGDATTTSYGVGVDGITCLRGMADGSLFVAAGNSNYLISKNYANNAPLIFGEYNLLRRFLFESTCINDRCILDSLGDTRFIDLNGVRSFNAIQQLMNEGRNEPFAANVASAFKGIVQDVAASILYDNYEFYAVKTVFGYVVAIYDTLSKCWSSFDTTQTGGSPIKQFAKIELGVQRLYAITADNKLYSLYTGDYATGLVITGAMNTSIVQGTETQRTNNAKNEVKLQSFRCILNKITQDSALSMTPIIDNRLSSSVPTVTKDIKYVPPALVYTGAAVLPDFNTQLTNLFIPTPNCEQGWKTSLIISWTGGGSIVQYSANLRDESPNNPLRTQATVT